MTYYEFTLKAAVTRIVVQAGETYDEALERAMDKAHDGLADQLSGPEGLVWEVERFLILDDQEVVQAQAEGKL